MGKLYNHKVKGDVETLIMGESPLEKNANERALYYNNQEELLDMSNEKTAAIVRVASEAG